MQQNYRRAFAQHTVHDLRIATLYVLKGDRSHAGDLITARSSLSPCDYGFVARCTATGAASSTGSSGITIHAMG
jgi:hypothetical protein